MAIYLVPLVCLLHVSSCSGSIKTSPLHQARVHMNGNRDASKDSTHTREHPRSSGVPGTFGKDVALIMAGAPYFNLSASQEVPTKVLLAALAVFALLMIGAIVHLSQAMQPRRSVLQEDDAVILVDTLAATEKLEKFSSIGCILLTAPNFAYGLTICLSFNVLPEEAINFSNEQKGITYGMFCAIASCAQLTSPCLGHFSDRLRTPYGRRRPVILCGSLASSAAITAMWLASLSLNLIIFSIALGLMVVSWAAISPALQALIRDIVQEEQIPFASAWSSCTFALGCTASFCISLWFEKHYHWQYVFCIGSTLLTAALALPVAKEPPLCEQGTVLECDWITWLKQSFYFNLQRHPEFGVLLLTKVIMSGIAVSKTFNVYFIRDVYQVLDDNTLVSKVATISLSAEVVATIVTFFVTWLRAASLLLHCRRAHNSLKLDVLDTSWLSGRIVWGFGDVWHALWHWSWLASCR